MKSFLLKPVQHLVRRGQVGQSIIIVALGFLGLLGFVGIVTDVSLMFVRFSSLRRAVDSAAVGAASQIRRLPEPVGGLDGEAIARNIAQANLAARQLIQFHGLDPEIVLVQTCATEGGLDPDLCTAEQRKLIRVTAQIDSPTIFMRLLGFPSLTLEASAISETAALDVVMILDVSESMLNETDYQEWVDIGFGKVYVPLRLRDIAGQQSPPLDRFAVDSWFFNKGQTEGQGALHNWAQLQTDFVNAFGPSVNFNPTTNGRSFDHPAASVAQNDPRPACRVRYFPNTFRTNIGDEVWNDPDVGPPFQAIWNSTHGFGGGGATRLDGYVGAYNFYGCCNDPRDLGNFSELICQPFKDARDAAFDFLDQIDFIRGDRVAFVTFDRQAFLIKVDNEDNDPTDGTVEVVHMIDRQDLAEQTLMYYVGVRSEPSFYEPYCYDEGNDNNQDCRDDPGSADDVDVRANDAMVPWQGFANEAGPVNYDTDLGLHDYPVVDNCTFQDAALPASVGGPDTFASIDTLDMPQPGWAINDPFHHYIMWGQCRGTNIGGALAQAGFALTDPASTRSVGTVWTMVLLSDGAAGGTDPVRRNGGIQSQAQPYASPPTGAGYGAYGACPYGSFPSALPNSQPTRLGLDEGGQPIAPHCLDDNPETRYFCGGIILEPDFTGIDTDSTGCDVNHYNADDYARDWADFIGIDDSGTGNVQLPTIFTIGFGLDPSDCDTPTPEDVPDCLGVELLRYIADVGDNFQVDSDYQQLYLEYGPSASNQASIDMFGDETLFGGHGECEENLPGDIETVADFRVIQGRYPNWNELTQRASDPDVNCGNYFNASADRASLTQVFDEIAQRMFVRIAS